MSHKLGQSLAETTRRTHDGLRHLHERLAVIDRAQSTISSLSGQVGQLQAILDNKQTRGAFGQGRMEALIQDALPPGSYQPARWALHAGQPAHGPHRLPARAQERPS